MSVTAQRPPEAGSGTPPQRRPLSGRARAERRLGWLLAGPAFVVMLLVTAYPVALALYESLFDHRLTDPANRSFVGLANYAVIVTDATWWASVAVTLSITVVTVAVPLVVGFGLALVMLRALSSIRPLLRAAILVPYAVVTVVSAYAWQYAFSPEVGFIDAWFAWVPGITGTTSWFDGTLDSLFVVCLAEIWKSTPFVSLLLLAGLVAVPVDLQEAARVDGATWWQRTARVTIPHMRAAIMVAALFRTLDAFRVFDSIFVMTGGAHGTETVSFLAYRQTIDRLEIGLGSAVSVMLFLCAAVLCLVLVKAFKVDLSSARGQ